MDISKQKAISILSEMIDEYGGEWIYFVNDSDDNYDEKDLKRDLFNTLNIDG